MFGIQHMVKAGTTCIVGKPGTSVQQHVTKHDNYFGAVAKSFRTTKQGLCVVFVRDDGWVLMVPWSDVVVIR